MDVNQLTKIARFIPTLTTMTNYGVVDYFIKIVTKIHGMPSEIICGWDPKFSSRIETILFKMCESKIKFSMV